MSEEERPVDHHYNPDKNMTEVYIANGARIYDPDEIERLTALVAEDGIDVACFVFDKQTGQWYIVTGDGETHGGVYSLAAGSLIITILDMLIRDSKMEAGSGDHSEYVAVPDGPDSFSGALQFERTDTSALEDFVKGMGDDQPPE